MPLDPVIAGGYRGVEIPNPMNQLAQLAQLQQLRDANALRQMQMEEYARARSEEAGIRQLFAKPDIDVSSPDFQRQLLGVSPKTGAGILKAQGELQTAATKRAEIDAKTLKQHIDLSQNQLAGVTTPEDYMAWHEANHRDPVLKKYFESRGITAEQSRARIEAALQRPGGLQQLIRESALGMEKALEMTTTPQDLGGTKRIIAMPKFGRPNELAGAVVPGSEGTVTAAPASAYDQWRMQNQGFTIENTANGLVRVDKATGAVTPLTMNNLPLMGNVNPQVIQGPNGPMVVQPSTGMAQPVMQPPAAPGGAATPVSAPLTAGEREWRNAVSRGEFTGSFVDWKKQTEPKRFEGTVESERAKSLQKEADEVSAAATSAARTLPALEVQASILNSGFRTGWGTEVQNAAASVLASLGVKDAEKFSTKAELFLSQTQSAVNDALAKQKGAQSDSDAKRASQIYTRLGNTPETNQFLVKMATAVARRDLEKKAFYDDWFKANKSYEGVDSAWQQGPGGKSIFDTPELQPYRLNSATPRAGGGQVVGGRTAAAPVSIAPAPAAPAPAAPAPAGRAKFLGFE